jgi:hypothetical protein
LAGLPTAETKPKHQPDLLIVIALIPHVSTNVPICPIDATAVLVTIRGIVIVIAIFVRHVVIVVIASDATATTTTTNDFYGNDESSNTTRKHRLHEISTLSSLLLHARGNA